MYWAEFDLKKMKLITGDDQYPDTEDQTHVEVDLYLDFIYAEGLTKDSARQKVIDKIRDLNIIFTRARNVLGEN